MKTTRISETRLTSIATTEPFVNIFCYNDSIEVIGTVEPAKEAYFVKMCSDSRFPMPKHIVDSYNLIGVNPRENITNGIRIYAKPTECFEMFPKGFDYFSDCELKEEPNYDAARIVKLGKLSTTQTLYRERKKKNKKGEGTKTANAPQKVRVVLGDKAFLEISPATDDDIATYPSASDIKNYVGNKAHLFYQGEYTYITTLPYVPFCILSKLGLTEFNEIQCVPFAHSSGFFVFFPSKQCSVDEAEIKPEEFVGHDVFVCPDCYSSTDKVEAVKNLFIS